MSAAAKLKTELVQLRLTPPEKEVLKRLAAQKHMTVSEYVRWLIYREELKLPK